MTRPRLPKTTGGRTRRNVVAILRRWRTRSGWVVVGILGTLATQVLYAQLVTPPPRNQLVIMSGKDFSIGGQRQALVDRWNSLHPDQTARIASLSEDADDQHSAMVAHAQSGTDDVDIYNLDVTWIAEFAAANYILPISQPDDADAYLEKTFETCEYDGKLWALPFNTDAALLYYNTKVVGPGTLATIPTALPPGQNDMTAMVKSDPDLKAGFVTQLDRYEGLTVNALETIWAAKGDVVDADNHVVIDHKEAINGLAALANGLTGDKPAILPASTTYNETLSRDAFKRGDAPLMRNWPVAYGHLAADPPVMTNLGVAAWPTASVLGGQNLAIANNSRNPTAARELIAFLTSEESERQLFLAGGLPATRTSAYSGQEVIVARPYAKVLLEAIKSARPRPQTPHYALFSAVLQGIVQYAMSHGGRLPDGAVHQLSSALQGRRE